MWLLDEHPPPPRPTMYYPVGPWCLFSGKGFTGLSGLQEQPGDMSGQHFSEKFRLSWREGGHQEGMRGGVEAARSRWYREGEGPSLEHGCRGWWGRCCLPHRGHSGFHEQNILRTGSVCKRDVNFLVRNTEAASPVPLFLRDVQQPWWACPSQAGCLAVEVSGQGKAEIVPSSVPTFMSLEESLLELQDMCSTTVRTCVSCKCYSREVHSRGRAECVPYPRRHTYMHTFKQALAYMYIHTIIHALTCMCIHMLP